MATTLSPLPFNVPIVDPKTGYPAPFFQRMLSDWLQEKAAAEGAAITLASLGGDPDADNLVMWDDSAGAFVFITPSEALDLIGSAAHGDILYRDSTGWALLAAGPDGDVLTTHGASADPTWETPPAGGGGTWALAGAGQTATGVWDQTVDGNKATVDFTGLSGSDVMIIARSVTKSVAGVLVLQVSVDNGSTYYSTSGNYILTSTTGAESNQTHFGQIVPGSSTAARTGSIIIPGFGLSGIPKVSDQIVANNGAHFFVASTSPIDAVRVISTGGGTLNGGQIYCLVR